MKKKILLIEPPFYRLYKDSYTLNRFPFALAYLSGSILENSNWIVKAYNSDFVQSISRMKTSNVNYLTNKGYKNYINNLYDFDYSVWEEVRRKIEEFDPDVIGISVKSSNFISACNVASIAKQFNRQIKIIMGGPYPTMAGKSIMDNSIIDISVVGEGEITIAELLKAMDNKASLDKIPGIIFRDGNDIIENERRVFINDLDQLTFPHEIAKDVLIDYNQYPLSAFKNIFATRGCPFDCTFCASKEIWTQKVRFRSAENVRKEVQGLMKLGINRIHFDDDTFGVNKIHISELCTQLNKYCKGIKWSCEIRADLIDETVLSQMKGAGCETIQMGVESGSDKILSIIKKNITVREVLNACKLIKQFKIELQTFFLAGLPQETEEDLKSTVKLMKRSKSDKIIYCIFTPYPYTPLFDYCKEHGLIDENHDPTLFNHQSPQNCFNFNISPERFRKIADNIENFVDRHNLNTRIRTMISQKGISRLKEVLSG